MRLEVLNAPNVQLANRELHGKRARQAERAGHPRCRGSSRSIARRPPSSTTPPGPALPGATRISSRSATTSPTTGAARSTTRTRPSGGTSPSSAAMPSPCGTRHRFADPKTRPTCLACDCSRITRAIERAGEIGAGPSNSGRTADRAVERLVWTRGSPRAWACRVARTRSSPGEASSARPRRPAARSTA